MSQWHVFNNEFRQVGEGEPAGAWPRRDCCLRKTKTCAFTWHPHLSPVRFGHSFATRNGAWRSNSRNISLKLSYMYHKQAGIFCFPISCIQM